MSYFNPLKVSYTGGSTFRGLQTLSDTEWADYIRWKTLKSLFDSGIGELTRSDRVPTGPFLEAGNEEPGYGQIAGDVTRWMHIGTIKDHYLGSQIYSDASGNLNRDDNSNNLEAAYTTLYTNDVTETQFLKSYLSEINYTGLAQTSYFDNDTASYLGLNWAGGYTVPYSRSDLANTVIGVDRVFDYTQTYSSGLINYQKTYTGPGLDLELDGYLSAGYVRISYTPNIGGFTTTYLGPGPFEIYSKEYVNELLEGVNLTYSGPDSYSKEYINAALQSYSTQYVTILNYIPSYLGAETWERGTLERWYTSYYHIYQDRYDSADETVPSATIEQRPLYVRNNGELAQWDDDIFDLVAAEILNDMVANDYWGVYTLQSISKFQPPRAGTWTALKVSVPEVPSPGQDIRPAPGHMIDLDVYNDSIYDDATRLGSFPGEFDEFDIFRLEPPTSAPVDEPSFCVMQGSLPDYSIRVATPSERALVYAKIFEHAKKIMVQTGIGRYVVSPDTPVYTGSWLQKGETRVDTLITQQSVILSYSNTPTYSENYLTQYATNYLSPAYTKTYSKDYVYDYVGDDWANPYLKAYTFEYGTAYTKAYAGNYTKTYTGSYTKTYSGNYSKEYTKTYVKNWTGNWAIAYVRNFSGSTGPTYTKNWAGTFVNNYNINYTKAYSGAFDTPYTGTFNFDYQTNYSTDYVKGYVTDYVTDYIGFTSYLTSYVTDYNTDYIGTYTQEYTKDYITGYSKPEQRTTWSLNTDTARNSKLFVRTA